MLGSLGNVKWFMNFLLHIYTQSVDRAKETKETENTDEQKVYRRRLANNNNQQFIIYNISNIFYAEHPNEVHFSIQKSYGWNND